MVFSRTMTAPTNLRGQVERDATTLAMFMKYSSQEARSGMGISTKKSTTAKDELLRPPGVAVSIGHVGISSGRLEVTEKRTHEAINSDVAIGDRQRGWLVKHILALK